MGAKERDPLPASPNLALDEAGYGGFIVFKELVRAPGAIFTEARGPTQSQALLQLAHCRPATLPAEQNELDEYVAMITAATNLLRKDQDHTLLRHGVQREPGGAVTLYWALPWPDGAQRLGLAITHIDSTVQVQHAAKSLLERVRDRHRRGRLDPLLSPQSLIIRPQGDVVVAGFPVHLPASWLSSDMPAPLLAPEEQPNSEPRRSGDLWRVGQTLEFLSRRLDTLPAALRNLIERLAKNEPSQRITDVDEALEELESLQDLVTASDPSRGAAAEVAARDSWPDLPATSADLHEMTSDDIPTRPHMPSLDRSQLSDDLELPDIPQTPAARALAPDTDEFMQAELNTVPDDEVDPTFEGPVPTQLDAEMAPDDTRTYSDDEIPHKAVAMALADRERTEPENPVDEDPSTAPEFPSPIRTPPQSSPRAKKQRPVVGQDQTVRVQLRPKIDADTLNDPQSERSTTIRAPSTIPDADTIMDVRPFDRPPKTPQTLAGGDTVVNREVIDTSSESTLRDVPKNQIAPGAVATGIGGPSAVRKEAIGAKSAWDRARKTDNKIKPMGPKGTLVGVRLIDDPTGLRSVPVTNDIPEMLPPPNLVADPEPSTPPSPEPSNPSAEPSSSPYALQEYFHGSDPSRNQVQSQPHPALAYPPPPATPTGSSPTPPPKQRNLLVGFVAFFIAGSLAALAAPYLLPGQQLLTIDEPPTPPRRVDITPVNEVVLQASPVDALVVSELDGRVLGKPPLKFLVGPDTEVAVLITATDHEPQRVTLPTRGRLTTELSRLENDVPCEIRLDIPRGLTLENVLVPVEMTRQSILVGAAVARARDGRGAWLIRCPELGGLDPHPIPERPSGHLVELEILSPTSATFYIDDKEVGTTAPLRTRVEMGFRKVTVEQLRHGRIDRWIPVFNPTRLSMPKPAEASASSP